MLQNALMIFKYEGISISCKYIYQKALYGQQRQQQIGENHNQGAGEFKLAKREEGDGDNDKLPQRPNRREQKAS